MVFRDPGPLTRISFSRDIKLFLSAVVGFLSVLILFLLITLQTFVGRAFEAVQLQRNTVADDVVRAIQDSDSSNYATIEASLVFARSQFGVAAVELKMPEKTITSGLTGGELVRIDRSTRLGTLTLFFDDYSWRRDRTVFYGIAGISFISTIGAILLLFLYLPRITRPIERMLHDAKRLETGSPADHHDEAEFLIETFRRSVETLREQEAELKRLHASEKHRADDLERVTATLTRSLTSGFVALDKSGDILEVNTAASEILSLSPEQVRGRTTLSNLLPGTEFARVLEDAVRTRASLNRVEITNETPSGVKTIGLTAVPLTGQEGAYLGMIVLFADLTPVRDLEVRVREMQTLADLGQIAAGIAHEFRNSLSTILGNLQLAAKQQPPEPVAARLSAASSEATQLSEAVTALLNFARPVKLQLSTVPLRQMIASIVERLPDLDAVEIEYGGDATIQGDATLLARAFENILRNAAESIERKATKGRIEITIEEDDLVRVSIRDNGVGIDPAESARLFLPFQSNRPGGFGLGLALTRKIVVLHGGSVSLDGEPGSGAVARVELPHDPAEAWSRSDELRDFVPVSSG